MAMGHRRANGVGDEGGLGQRAALVATRAQAPLLAGKGEEEFVAAIGAVQASETGMEIAAAEKRRDGGGGLRMQGWEGVRVIVEDLPDGRGAGLAGAVSDADHWFRRADGSARGQEFPLSLACEVLKGAWRRGKETSVHMNTYANKAKRREWCQAVIVVNPKGRNNETGRGP